MTKARSEILPPSMAQTPEAHPFVDHVDAAAVVGLVGLQELVDALQAGAARHLAPALRLQNLRLGFRV